MVLPITLTMAAAAALINLWLAIRVGRVRHAAGVSVGDGGNELVMRRMRAQANFVEYTPFFVLLVAALEIAGQGGIVLWTVGYVFMLARIAHAFGMDGGKLVKGRMIGMMVTMLAMLGLPLWALWTALA